MRFRVFILVIFIFLLQSVHGGVSEQLVTLLADCPASVAADYASTIPAITKKMRDQVATLKAVVPRACYLELGESQLETALVLGNYGLIR